MTSFFTADTHFGDARLLRFRPFGSLEEHDEAIIARWNARVGPDDMVWHLGDFASGADRARCRAIFQRLSGTKRLVVGNHDTRRVLDLPWAEAPAERARLNLAGAAGEVSLFLSHYPMRSWPGVWRGVRHLFGHTHGTLPGSALACDVGVDPCGFAPLSLDEVVARQDATAEPPEEIALWAARRGART